MFYKTDEEIELIRESCVLVCKTLAHIATILKPGITGIEIDKAAEEFIRDHNAVPGFKGYRGFPSSLCISKNEVVVHGIPSKVPFTETDIVSVDCGVLKNEFYGDAAYTFILNGVAEETIKLCKITKESLYLGIEQAIVGKRVGDIGYAIQYHAEIKHKFGIVRELVGHGVGKSLHEPPNVMNYGSRGDGPILKEGLVIAIEPMVNQGTRKIKQLADGWTITSMDMKPSAHYEHTVAVKKGKADILSDHSYIEESIKNNRNISDISINF